MCKDDLVDIEIYFLYNRAIQRNVVVPINCGEFVADGSGAFRATFIRFFKRLFVCVCRS
jgi:hypothetical protein